MYAPIHYALIAPRLMPSPIEAPATTVSISRPGIFKYYGPIALPHDVHPQKIFPWSVGTASTFRTLDVSLQGIEYLYSVPDRRAVREFILDNQDLAEVLIDAFGPLTEAFGPFPQVCLSVVRDPEIENSAELLGSILTPLGVNEALDRLTRFDERWFLRQLQRANGRLVFNLEFV